MSETGGPVFEGVGRPEAQPKQGVVERMKARYAAKVEKQQKETNSRKARKEEFKKIGPDLEKTYIEAYQKIVNTLGEGKLKKAGEFILPLIKAQAKLARVSAAVPDIFFGYSFARNGLLDTFSGYGNALFNRNALFRDVFTNVVAGHVETSIGAAILWQAPTRKIATRLIEFGGNVGEKTVAGITNKIIGRKPQTVAMAG